MANKRGPSKAEMVLKGARDRVLRAQERVAREQEIVDEAEGELKLANAILSAHQFNLEQLEKDLAQTPSKKASAPKSAPSASKRSSRKSETEKSTQNTADDSVSALPASLCAICGNVKEFEDHDKGSASFHIFRTSVKKKNGDAIVLPENPDNFLDGAMA